MRAGMRRFACAALKRYTQHAAAPVEPAAATWQPVAALPESQARQFTSVGAAWSHANHTPQQDQQQEQAAGAAPPPQQQAAAAAGGAASVPDPSWKPPYRLRSEGQRDLDEQVVEFAERLFAADLDGGQAGEQAVAGSPAGDTRGAPSAAGSCPSPLKAAGGEAAAETAQAEAASPEVAASFAEEAADAYFQGSRARTRRELSRAEQRARKQLVGAWSS